MVEWILDPMSPNDRTLFQQFDPAPGKHAKTRHKSFDCSVMRPKRTYALYCHYVAGMTDDFLLKIYDRLFCQYIGSVFDRL